MNNKLTVQNINETLLVDSREVAYILGKENSNFSKSISKYITDLNSEKYIYRDFFRGTDYNPKTQRYRYYLITEKGCDLITKKLRFGEDFKRIYKHNFEEYIYKSNLLNITTIAKELKMSGLQLNKILSKYNIQYKEDGVWYFDKNYNFLLTEKFADYQESPYKDWKKTLKWTEKGRQWIIQFLKENNEMNIV